MSGPLIVTAPAKVNLFLHVGTRRADGYHDLESLVAFTAFGDEISLAGDDEISLSLSGPFGADLADEEDNLVLRAVKLLSRNIGTEQGVRVGLQKNIPVASGLGGGSADAAAVLRGLVRLWQIDPDRNRLLEAAESLGADVPVCLASETSWMEGKGERLRALPPLPKTGVLLVNPGVQVSTAQIFAALGPRRGTGMPPPQSAFPDVHALVRFLRGTDNDLQLPAQTIAPIIASLLREMNGLPGALFARMSGSGATCFALFPDEAETATAARHLRTAHSEWWVCETAFLR